MAPQIEPLPAGWWRKRAKEYGTPHTPGPFDPVRAPDGRHPECWACTHDGPLENDGAWFHLPIFSAAGPKLPCPCPPPGTEHA